LTSSRSALGGAFCPGTDLTSSLFGMAYMRCDDANRFAKLSKRSGCTVPVVRCQPWFYLRLVAYGFIGLSEGA
jgi:hypothetical protein